MAGYDDFWGRMNKAGPGMIDMGLGLFGQRQAQNEAAQRLRAAQGPAYQGAMSVASADPAAAATKDFKAAQGMLAGVDAKSEADLMRMLYAKGMLGVANYNPGVEGIAPSATAMNPHMAAYYAARGGRDAKMALDARDRAEMSQGRALDRAGQAQRIGMDAQGSQPSRSAATMNLLKGASGILKDTGMFDMGMDWLKKSFGGGDALGMFGDTDFTWGF
jgi:hypothetical protein